MYVFPGATAAVESACAESGLDPAKMTRLLGEIKPFHKLVTLVSQAGSSPDPDAMLDAAQQHITELRTALGAALRIMADARDGVSRHTATQTKEPHGSHEKHETGRSHAARASR